MARQLITVDRLREVLDYSPASGQFAWKVSGRGRFKRAGEKAWTMNHHGYIVITVDGEFHAAHRLAWAHAVGSWPAGEIDHINGDRADNRIENLRDVDARTNRENLRGAKRNSSTGVLGVTMRGGRPIAVITVAGKQKYLGAFDSVDAAHAAYVAEKRASHVGCTL